MRKAVAIVVAVLIAGALVRPASGATHAADFGKQWVRQHPLTTMGLQGSAQTLRMDLYQAANMSNMLAWWADGHGDDIAAVASAAGMPWHALIVDGEGEESERITRYASVGNAAGWMLGDEIPRQGMSFYGNLATWTKANRPNEIVYTNVLPTYATAAQLYGGTPPAGGYSYTQYLEDTVQIIKPEVLMYDHYPFLGSTGMRADYFDNLMAVRAKASEHNLPYWAFAQSYAGGGYRLPSESDVRMQVYSRLAAGYTGVAYFTFDHFGDAAILDTNGNPTALFGPVQALNAEIAVVGGPLRFLSSQDVRFLPGTHTQNSTLVPNGAPSGLSNFAIGAGGDPHIQKVDVIQSGAGKDGLLGVFADDTGGRAFMLTNLYHGNTLSATTASLQFRMTFDAGVDSLVRFNQQTGAQEIVPLTSHQLMVTVPGGTGLLYRYELAPSAWSVNGSSGSWSLSSNWSSGPVNVVDGEARFFGRVMPGPIAVTVPGPVTAGTIKFDGSNAYTLGGAGTITMAVSAAGAKAALTVTSGSHTIAAPLAFNFNDALVTVSPASSTLTLSNLQSTSTNLEKGGTGTLVVNNVRVGGLSVKSGKLRVQPSGGSVAGVSKVTTLSVIGSAALDLTDNKLIVTTPGRLSAVTTLITTGRNGGAWNGAGIVTTSATPGSNFTSIGVATAQQVKNLPNATDTAMWAGQAVTGSDTLVMYTYGGDANLDGRITVDDYGRIDFNVGLGTSGWFNGDFNYDGNISVDDYGIIDFNVGIQGAPFFSSTAARGFADPTTSSAVPEPATSLATLVIAMTAFAPRGCRRSSHP
jgi:hypothetical protein